MQVSKLTGLRTPGQRVTVCPQDGMSHRRPQCCLDKGLFFPAPRNPRSVMFMAGTDLPTWRFGYLEE